LFPKRFLTLSAAPSSILETHEYFNPDRWNKTDLTHVFETGSKIEFFSADQPGKVHGPRHDRLFINEANNIPYEICPARSAHQRVCIHLRALDPLQRRLSTAFRWPIGGQRIKLHSLQRQNHAALLPPHRRPVGGAIYIVEASQSARTEATNHNGTGRVRPRRTDPINRTLICVIVIRTDRFDF
jgi:hypothetical protein